MLTIIDTPFLEKTLIDDLMNDRCAVLWCRSFIDPAEAMAIAEQITSRCEITPYANIDESVGRVGQSLYETLGNDGQTRHDILQSYLESRPAMLDRIRRACAPYEVPLERFYRLIDKFYGAELATYNGRELFSGIVRVIPSGEDVVPHNDSFSRDVPELEIAREVDGQFAANIYLRLPDEGGELQLWDLRPSDEELARIPMSEVGYGNDRHYFGQPDVHIRPKPGDLVCFRGNLMHGIARAGTGLRMNMNCFVARRKNGSLIYWS
ncbi:MAG TPA: 2OG-Fe(II) oxygenase [Trebonia sp.]|nr:2OG-Fe(II) oxygenase [Trebonia sp.]